VFAQIFAVFIAERVSFDKVAQEQNIVCYLTRHPTTVSVCLDFQKSQETVERIAQKQLQVFGSTKGNVYFP